MGNRRKTLEEIYGAMEVKLDEIKLENLLKPEERKYIEYEPNFQRKYRWTEKKATNLVETVLINGIIPPLTVLRKGKKMIIIDRKAKI